MNDDNSETTQTIAANLALAIRAALSRLSLAEIGVILGGEVFAFGDLLEDVGRDCYANASLQTRFALDAISQRNGV